MDNQISNMLVKIATHIENPIERVEYIHEQTNQGKTRHKAIGAKALSKMADAVPFGLANLAAGLYSKYNIKEFHRPPFNVTITNVPGPQNALYLRGHKIVSIFGLTPVLDGFGLIIAAFSYNGLVSITTTSDAKTMPDADKFSRYIRESANELEEVILKRKKDIPENTVEKLQSKPIFTALRKFLNSKPSYLKTYAGVYDFEIKSPSSIVNYSLSILGNKVSIKKIKTGKPTLKIEIEDAIFYAVFKKKLLLEEVIIQGRLKLTGTKKSETKFLQLMSKFLGNS